MAEERLPDWWEYPCCCEQGHVWGPALVLGCATVPAMDDEDRKHVEEMLRRPRQLDNGPDHFPRPDGSEEPLSPGLNHAWALVRCPRYRYDGGWD
jgi:hypothetical protein